VAFIARKREKNLKRIFFKNRFEDNLQQSTTYFFLISFFAHTALNFNPMPMMPLDTNICDFVWPENLASIFRGSIQGIYYT